MEIILGQKSCLLNGAGEAYYTSQYSWARKSMRTSFVNGLTFDKIWNPDSHYQSKIDIDKILARSSFEVARNLKISIVSYWICGSCSNWCTWRTRVSLQKYPTHFQWSDQPFHGSALRLYPDHECPLRLQRRWQELSTICRGFRLDLRRCPFEDLRYQPHERGTRCSTLQEAGYFLPFVSDIATQSLHRQTYSR